MGNTFLYKEISKAVNEKIARNISNFIINSYFSNDTYEYNRNINNDFGFKFKNEVLSFVFPFAFKVQAKICIVDFVEYDNLFREKIKRDYPCDGYEYFYFKDINDDKNYRRKIIGLDDVEKSIGIAKSDFQELVNTPDVMADKSESLKEYLHLKLYKYKKLSQDCPLTTKYSRASTYLRNSLEGKTIFFSSPADLNDPFECSVGNKLSAERYNSYKIYSCSKKSDDILMWPYYADSHKGICLEYSFEDIYYESKKLSNDFFFGEVIYTSKRITTSLFDILKTMFDEESAKIIFTLFVVFTKSVEWEHEDEFRFVLKGDNNNDGIIVNNVDITDLIVGYKANITNLKEIDHIKIQNDEYKKVVPDEAQYRLNIK